MHRCPELSNLPKAKSLKSVNFRGTTPGYSGALITPELPFRRHSLIDPTHPAAALPRTVHRTFPRFRTDELGVRVFPKALLSKPEVEHSAPPYNFSGYGLSWRDRFIEIAKENEGALGGKGEEKDGKRKKKGDVVDMSMVCVIRKKTVHKSSFIRSKIVTRLKVALGLVLARGADVEKMTRAEKDKWAEQTRVVFTEDERRKQVLSDWTYIFYPTLAIYRMPYTTLVPLLRKLLDSVYAQGLRMEEAWMKQASRQIEREESTRQRVPPLHTHALEAEVTHMPLSPAEHGTQTRAAESDVSKTDTLVLEDTGKDQSAPTSLSHLRSDPDSPLLFANPSNATGVLESEPSARKRRGTAPSNSTDEETSGADSDDADTKRPSWSKSFEPLQHVNPSDSHPTPAFSSGRAGKPIRGRVPFGLRAPPTELAPCSSPPSSPDAMPSSTNPSPTKSARSTLPATAGATPLKTDTSRDVPPDTTEPAESPFLYSSNARIGDEGQEKPAYTGVPLFKRRPVYIAPPSSARTGRGKR